MPKFRDLPDGAYFILAGRNTDKRKFQRVLEDGFTNAVDAINTNICVCVPLDAEVLAVPFIHDGQVTALRRYFKYRRMEGYSITSVYYQIKAVAAFYAIR